MSEKPKILLRESYLAMIENSPGTKMFRSVFAETENGKKEDILNDGKLSCAYFVSSLLLPFRLIERVHVTVPGTMKDLTASGWGLIDVVREGAVVLWRSREYPDGEAHAHVGFALRAGEAVSTDYAKKEVVRHPMTELNGRREVESLWWHPALDNAG